MFAPNHHPAMKNVAPVRKELGVRTIFNILGPLTNPAGAPNILMGVFHPDLVGIQVRALQRLGAEHAVVVYGRDGMDEVSLGAATLVGELKNGQITEYEIHPEDFGLQMASNRALKVETPEQSRAMLLGVLRGDAGPAREIVCLNAGVALWSMLIVAGSGVVGRFLYLLTHRGLAGEHEELGRLLHGLGLSEARGDSVWSDTPSVTTPLHRFVDDARDLAQRPGHDLAGHVAAFVLLPWRRRLEIRAARKASRAWARRGDPSHDLTAITEAYAGALRVAQFGRATRLFELWHVLHIPFVYLMVICAVVHIVAVHVY